jgi:hypothetical protein
VSSDFDDLFVVIGGDKKAVNAVKKALKKKVEEERTCEEAEKYPDWKHLKVKPRRIGYGWNGFENAYHESIDLCEECYEATPERSLS